MRNGGFDDGASVKQYHNSNKKLSKIKKLLYHFIKNANDYFNHYAKVFECRVNIF